MRDALEVPPGLDPGIEPMVRVLRLAGVETFESCESGPGHAYREPTVRFYGDRSEGLRALAEVLGKHNLRVTDLRRAWPVDDGEPTGPYWELVFATGPSERIPGTEEGHQSRRPGTPSRCCSRCHRECCCDARL